MKKFAAFLLLFGLSLHAAWEDRLYTPKYLSGKRLQSVCQLAASMNSQSGPMTVQPILELKVIHIAGSAEAVNKAEEIIKRFDVPEPARPSQSQITFTVSLIRGSLGMAAPGEVLHPVPKDLESVITEMKRSFAYTNYSLLDTLVLPVNDNADMQGVLPELHSHNVEAYFYRLVLKNVGVQEDGKTIVVNSFGFTVKVPYAAGNEMKDGTSGIETSLRIQPGQKLVVGKVKINPSDNTDVFLVLTADLK